MLILVSERTERWHSDGTREAGVHWPTTRGVCKGGLRCRQARWVQLQCHSYNPVWRPCQSRWYGTSTGLV